MMKFLFPLLLIAAIAFGCNSSTQLLEGRWVSVQDPLSELQFDKDVAHNYYESKPMDTLTYELTYTSCDAGRPASKSGARFIKWSDGLCHEIVTLNENTLELIYTGNGRTLTYKKK